MRYVVTLNGKDHALALTQDNSHADPEPKYLISDKDSDTPHRAEILSRSTDGTSTVLTVDGRVVRFEGPHCSPLGHVTVNGQPLLVQCDTELRRRAGSVRAGKRQGPLAIVAPLPGRVLKIFVQPDQQVEKNTPLLSIEAMKMENEIRSPRAGIVSAVHVNADATVETNQLLLSLAPE